MIPKLFGKQWLTQTPPRAGGAEQILSSQQGVPKGHQRLLQLPGHPCAHQVTAHHCSPQHPTHPKHTIHTFGHHFSKARPCPQPYCNHGNELKEKQDSQARGACRSGEPSGFHQCTQSSCRASMSHQLCKQSLSRSITQAPSHCSALIF